MIAEFAQVVGLLSAFSSGRKSDEMLSVAEFLSWLTDHNHEEIRKIVEQNQTTSISIKSFLNNGVDNINARLDEISAQIAILGSRTEGMEDLAAVFATESISEQALEILMLMEENNTEFFSLSQEINTKDKRLILHPGPNCLCKEKRFFKNDLELMLNLGRLIQDSNPKGEPIYCYTRAASTLVNGMK